MKSPLAFPGRKCAAVGCRCAVSTAGDPFCRRCREEVDALRSGENVDTLGCAWIGVLLFIVAGILVAIARGCA